MKHVANTRGWTVALAGLGINLALGVLYAWSVVAKSLTTEWGWSAGEASLPYATAVGVFALSMVFAGRAQDRLGPRVVATVRRRAHGLGMIVASFGTAENAVPDPPRLRADGRHGHRPRLRGRHACRRQVVSAGRKGLITGTRRRRLWPRERLHRAAHSDAAWHLRCLFELPRPWHRLPRRDRRLRAVARQSAGRLRACGQRSSGCGIGSFGPTVPRDYDWREMVRTPQFALLWLMYAFAAFAGLMIIGHMAKLAALQMPGTDLGFLLVAVLAIGNALGRVAAGVVSDRIGGTRTMLIVFVLQAVMMGLLSHGVPRASRAGGSARRLRLWSQPFALPVHHHRLLRHEEHGRELRARVHGLGCRRRVRLDDRGLDRRLHRRLRACLCGRRRTVPVAAVSRSSRSHRPRPWPSRRRGTQAA